MYKYTHIYIHAQVLIYNHVYVCMYICCIWLLHYYSNMMTLYDSHSVYDYANECFDLCSGLFLLCCLWTVSRFVSTNQSTPSPCEMRRPTSWVGRTTHVVIFLGGMGHQSGCRGHDAQRGVAGCSLVGRQTESLGWKSTRMALMSSVGASFHLEPWAPACQLQGPSHY